MGMICAELRIICLESGKKLDKVCKDGAGKEMGIRGSANKEEGVGTKRTRSCLCYYSLGLYKQPNILKYYDYIQEQNTV